MIFLESAFSLEEYEREYKRLLSLGDTQDKAQEQAELHGVEGHDGVGPLQGSPHFAAR